MSNDERLLEQLKQLRPATGNLNRDRLIYLAGRASVRPKRIWPCCVASSATAAVAATVLVLALPVRRTISTRANVDVAATQSEKSSHEHSVSQILPTALDSRSYWRLRQAGVEGDEPVSSAMPDTLPNQLPPSQDRLLKALLNES